MSRVGKAKTEPSMETCGGQASAEQYLWPSQRTIAADAVRQDVAGGDVPGVSDWAF